MSDETQPGRTVRPRHVALAGPAIASGVCRTLAAALAAVMKSHVVVVVLVHVRVLRVLRVLRGDLERAL